MTRWAAAPIGWQEPLEQADRRLETVRLAWKEAAVEARERSPSSILKTVPNASRQGGVDSAHASSICAKAKWRVFVTVGSHAHLMQPITASVAAPAQKQYVLP